MSLTSRLIEKIPMLRYSRSLRVRLILTILGVGVLPALVFSAVILSGYRSLAVANRTSQVRNQCLILANHLFTCDYLSNPAQEVVNTELAQLSNLYDGRVMIINSDYKIIKDTYSISQGKYMIAEEVIRCFNKENTSLHDDANHFIELTTPITDTSGEQVYGVMLTSVSTDEIFLMVQSLRTRLGLIAGVITLLVIIVALAVSSEFLRPYKELKATVTDIQEGFGEKPVNLTRYMETEEITEAFNALFGRMKTLDDSRQEFVSNVSHELKTPITAIKVLADSLNQQDNVPIEVYKDFMGDIVHEIDREDKIISDLLSLVRMNRDSSVLDIHPTDIGELLSALMRRLQPIADSQEVNLILETVRDVTAEVDATKLSLAITNLVENGIKYNTKGGTVKVVLDAEPMIFSIIVSDDGMGIPKEEQANIFERFYRVDKSHSREIGGTGLGLSITRSAVLMHKGAIKVDSEIGEGTTFTVKIPISYVVNNAEKKPQ